MRIGITGDTHGSAQAIRRILQQTPPIELWLHTGDYAADANRLHDATGIKTVRVRGNCDFGYPDEPVQALCAFGGVLFFYTHGHHYGVKSGVYQIMEAGEERLADVVLYGHTHRQQIDEGGEGCPTAFNPGSLGFGGQYGVIECQDGEFTIQECRVPAAERG